MRPCCSSSASNIRYTRPYRPQTNGKVERLWRTLDEDVIEGATFDNLDHFANELFEYLIYYNNHRPHQALAGKDPRRPSPLSQDHRDPISELVNIDSNDGGEKMNYITLDSETDFVGWRKAARALALNDVKPSDVSWRVDGDAPELFAPTTPPLDPPSGTFNVAAKFVELAEVAILHRNPERFALLYRLLWRLRNSTTICLISRPIPTWPRSRRWRRAVRRDEHKMHAFVRFREVGREQKSHFVAWFEPEHHIVELAAPFFARRFADMPWSILTPDVCAHWDGHAVSITPGVSQERGADRGPAGRNLAALLRQHLQSRPG